MEISFPLSAYSQDDLPSIAMGHYAKATYLAACRIAAGDGVDAQEVHDSMSDGGELPELADCVRLSEVATMPAGTFAEFLMAIDMLEESDDTTFYGYDGSSLGSFGNTSQMNSIPDFLMAMADNALPDVSVPLIPLVRAAAQMSSAMAQGQGATDAMLVSALSAYYASFDPRFQAIFYPSTWAKLASISSAAYEDLSSALAWELEEVGVPERQDLDWCWRALVRVTPHSQVRLALGTADDAAGIGLRKLLSDIELLHDGDDGTVQCGRSLVPKMEGHEIMGTGIVGTPEDVLYPELGTLPSMCPDISLQLAVMEIVASGHSCPATVGGMVTVIMGYLAKEDSIDDDDRMALRQLTALMSGRRQQSMTSGSKDLRGALLVKEIRLQYVLICLLSQSSDVTIRELPISLRQLLALMSGFKTTTLVSAFKSDLQMPDDVTPRDIVDKMAGEIDDQAKLRERRTYGVIRYDILRLTMSAMASVLIPIRMRPSTFKLTTPGLFSAMMEIPSALTDIYGGLSKRKAFDTMSRMLPPDMSTHPMWVIVNHSMPPLTMPDKAAHSVSEAIGSLANTLRSILHIGESVSSEDVAQWIRFYRGLFDLSISDDQGQTDGGDALTAAVYAAFKDSCPGWDEAEQQEHGSLEYAMRMLVDVLNDLSSQSSKGLMAGRTRQHWLVSSVLRVADTISRSLRASGRMCEANAEFMALARGMKVPVANLVSAHAVFLALMATTAATTQFPDADLRGAAGDVADAAYPLVWFPIAKPAATVAVPSHGASDSTPAAAKTLDELLGLPTESPDAAAEGRATLRALARFGTDMLAEAQAGKLSHVVERDEELRQVTSILLRREKANIMILGEAGTGKTALVELLARGMSAGSVPQKLMSKNLVRLDAMLLTACDEQHLKDIFNEAERANAILFIDEIHALHGNILTVMKPYLARAGLSIIGATTNKEYQATILRDKALARRFSVIRLHELTQEQTVICLKARMPEYEQWFSATYDTKVPYTVAQAAATYMTNRHSPDRELDIIDTAGSIATMAGRNVVTEDDAYAAVRMLSGNRTVLSVSAVAESLRASDNSELAKRSERAFGDVVGQDEAKSKLVEHLAISQVGMHGSNSPRNVLLFAGPSGVGKTMMAERIPEFLGTSEDAVLSLNMSEFVRGHEYSRLVGSPPGYIGSDQGGVLTDFGMAHPDGVIIFDEIEKAHKKVRQMLLNLFDRGYVDSAMGEHVDFRSTTLICTSNAGFDTGSDSPIGFVSEMDTKSYEERVSECRETLVKVLTAPFVGRFDEILVFNELTVDDIKLSCHIEYGKIAKAYKGTSGIDIAEFYPESKLDEILESTSDAEIASTGARSIMRRVEREIKKAFVFRG